MAVLLGAQTIGLDPKLKTVLEELIAQLQVGFAALPAIQPAW